MHSLSLGLGFFISALFISLQREDQIEIYIYHLPCADYCCLACAALERTRLVRNIAHAAVITSCNSKLQSAEQVLVVDVHITIPRT